MTEMRILTVRQPWAWAIIHGGKGIENRVRNIAGDYRGPVAIHAGLALDTEYDRALVSRAAGQISREKRDIGMRMVPSRITEPDEPRFHVTERYGYRGAIIGVVDLVDVHSASVIDGDGRIRDDCPEHGTCHHHCSPWALGPAARGWYQHLVFSSPRPLADPIPYRGALGLRRLNLAATARIVAQIGA